MSYNYPSITDVKNGKENKIELVNSFTNTDNDLNKMLDDDEKSNEINDSKTIYSGKKHKTGNKTKDIKKRDTLSIFDSNDERNDCDDITIDILNTTPTNSISIEDSVNIENLINNNYRDNDNFSNQIRKATASTNTDTSDYLFNHTRVEIKQKLNATIVRDINDTIRWRFVFRKCGNYFEFLSLVTSLISTVLAFSAGSFDNTYLAFTAGCLGSISLAFMKATSYAMKESKERNEQLNMILDKARIKYLPSLIPEDS